MTNPEKTGGEDIVDAEIVSDQEIDEGELKAQRAKAIEKFRKDNPDQAHLGDGEILQQLNLSSEANKKE
ncbi:hypothetical protein A2V71_02870 [Candidatus Berkelbacteria bacterium RBG_13_40_8]|uniref:Uncharacterized protein n=1 Tax=Candidatus Berkelbacteria bacterium RBG_13_40_8 TaxID=1797467 RepID=A0A1F5DMH6_9BACT|nr:MAG: hypothetical protein A2V71_02870 [Candidatus Berkelbacteria bacterium RBG_13_40_8]